MEKFNPKSVLVSASGGTIDYVSASGEVLRSVLVPPGVQPALLYFQLTPPGAHLDIAEGLELVTPKGGYGVQPYGAAAYDTGANPDYQPTSASRMERQMRKTLADMQQATKRIEARAKALEGVERIPKAPKEPKEKPGEVVEPVTVPDGEQTVS